jgi:rhamnosyltransferase
MKIQAVLAHFDVNDQFNTNFIGLVEVLKSLNIEITIVTTCDLDPDHYFLGNQVKIIKRPNLGYDFYSYKVGIVDTLTGQMPEKLILLNSSFFVADYVLFKKTIENLLDSLDSSAISGLVLSRQFSEHLQSYLLGFSAEFLRANWFSNFIQSIEPLNSKSEIIHFYEIGFSQMARAFGNELKSIFELNFFDKIRVVTRYLILSLKENPFLFFGRLRLFEKHNPSHYAFDILLKRHGIIKYELLHKNPMKIRRRLINKMNKKVAGDLPPIAEKNEGLVKMGWEESNVRTVCVQKSGKPKIVVVLHLYYRSLIPELASYLKRIPDPFDLHITTSQEGLVRVSLDAFYDVANSITVHIGPNSGRDVEPFISLYKAGCMDQYELGLKLHSKKSVHHPKGDFWRKRIFSGLLFDYNNIKEILKTLTVDKVGMIGGTSEYVVNEREWGQNFEKSSKILDSLGLGDLTLKDLGFFAGTMFWFRIEAFKNLKELNGSNLDFEAEGGQLDGTLAHTFERIFPLLVERNGYKVFGANNLECNIRDLDLTNKIPVLEN